LLRRDSFIGFCFFVNAIKWQESRFDFNFIFGTAITFLISLLFLFKAFGKIKIEIDCERIAVKNPQLAFEITEPLKTSDVKRWFFDIKETEWAKEYILNVQLKRGDYITIASKIRLKSNEEADAITQILNDSTKFHQLSSSEK
jgi:hypothetical protein